MNKSFKKNEIVIVNSDDPDYEEINNLEVKIREIYTDEDGLPYYLIKHNGTLWGIDHKDLVYTGKFAEPESYSNTRVIVSNDGEIKQVIDEPKENK